MSGPVFVGLGTNIGSRFDNLQQAVDAMSDCIAIRSVSSVYETEPVGFEQQPWFLNAVVCGDTPLAPDRLLDRLQQIELLMGRERTGVDKGPRVIDLDILFYCDIISAGRRLTIPHPALPQRTFVLAPLAEIAPGWVHPVLNKNMRQLYETVNSAKQAVKWTQKKLSI